MCRGSCQIVLSAKKSKHGSNGSELEGGGVLAGLALSDQVSFLAETWRTKRKKSGRDLRLTRQRNPMQSLKVKMTLTSSRNRFKIQGGWSNMAKGRVVGEGREGRGWSKQGHVGSAENFSFYSGRGRKHLESFSREGTRRTSHLGRSLWLPCATLS